MPRFVLPLLAACLSIAISCSAQPPEGAQPAEGAQPPEGAQPAEKKAAGGPAAAEGRNRLGDETSPYLRLHKDNPVHWWAWGPEALAAAREQDKPILLSIGYSACHWCHVMNRESFQDPEIAAYVNEHFIAVKLDREERPDIDKLYMNAVQALTGRGGWPLNVFLMPDGRPFVGGTYFPPSDRRGPDGRVVMPGFDGVLRQVVGFYENQRPQIEQQAAMLTEYLRKQADERPDLPVSLSPAAVDATVQSMLASRDPEEGGSGTDGPKFPRPSAPLLLLAAAGDRSDEALAAVRLQADRMARRGMYDQLGGGWHRYSTDRQWIVPHFEKMLYDQAQLFSLYARLHELTEQPLYRRVVAESNAFLRREMTSPDGLYFSALDADSEHQEGKFYVWTGEELDAILGADAAWFRKATGSDGAPNFEGKHILLREQSIAEMAAERGVTPERMQADWDAAAAKLMAVREKRIRPLLDTKALTSWNGLMVVGLVDAHEAFGDDSYLADARRTTDALLEHQRTGAGTLLHQRIDGVSKGEAFLDSYAATVLAALAVHRVTGEPQYLTAARELAAVMVDRFYDDEAGAFDYRAAGEDGPLLAPIREVYDGAVPSGNSLAVDALMRLDAATGADEHLEQVRRTFDRFAPNLIGAGAASPYMTLLLHRFLTRRGAGALAQSSAPAEEPDMAAPAAVATKGNASPAPLPAVFRSVRFEDVTAADGVLSATLVVELADRWHVNANPANPDYLIATKLTLAAGAEGLELVGVDYPKAVSLVLGGFDQPIDVYEGAFRIGVRLGFAGERPQSVPLVLDYQACDDQACQAPATLPLDLR